MVVTGTTNRHDFVVGHGAGVAIAFCDVLILR